MKRFLTDADNDPTNRTTLMLELRDPLIDYLSTQAPPEEKKESFEKLALIHSFFGRELPNAYKVERITLLIQRIVHGEETKASEILNILPNLLTNTRGKGMDYSGRKIENLTPFEAALATGDTNMLYMMTPYFDRLERGQAIMQLHFKQIFPDKKGESRIFPDAEGGLDGHFKRQKANVYDFSDLVAAFETANDKPDELQDALNKIGASFTETPGAKAKPYDQLTLTEKLNRFRETFTEKSHAEVVFNREHLLRAFAIYDEKFGHWNSDQRNLFWCQVIGFVQRFLPACDAQVFAQGLYNFVKDNAALNRSLNYRYDGGSFYPADLNVCCDLGFDFASHGWASYSRCGERLLVLGMGASGAPLRNIQNLYQAKTLFLEGLCRPALHQQLVA